MEALLAVQGTPLQPNPGSTDARITTRLEPGLANSEVIGDPITKQEVARELGEQRPFYFMREDVRTIALKIGYTDRCPGCRAVRLNLTSRPVHSEECHARMEPEIKVAKGQRSYGAI